MLEEGDAVADGRASSKAVCDSERDPRERVRRRGWIAWHCLHRTWDAADRAREEQQARSQAWGAAISLALDDDQLADAIKQVTRPVAALERRSLPVARAQLLAWAVAVRTADPAVPLTDALVADLDSGPREPDGLDGGLPDPPPDRGSDDDLLDRIAAVIKQRPVLDRDAFPQAERHRPQTERTVERVLDRGL